MKLFRVIALPIPLQAGDVIAGWALSVFRMRISVLKIIGEDNKAHFQLRYAAF